MTFIHIIDGIPVRDRKTKTKGHLHSIIGRAPDGSFIEQSRDHNQVVQRQLYPDGRVILTCFTERGGVIAQIDEREYYLRAPTP